MGGASTSWDLTGGDPAGEGSTFTSLIYSAHSQVAAEPCQDADWLVSKAGPLNKGESGLQVAGAVPLPPGLESTPRLQCFWGARSPAVCTGFPPTLPGASLLPRRHLSAPQLCLALKSCTPESQAGRSRTDPGGLSQLLWCWVPGQVPPLPSR